MKKLILLIAASIILLSCTGKRTYTVEIEDCRSGRLDTISVYSSGDPKIATYKLAVPTLTANHGWNQVKINVCNMKILNVK